MAAAPALGSPVTARSVLLTLLLGLGGEAGAAVQVLVVSGLGGDAQYDTQFAALGHDIAAASRTVTGEASRVQQLAGAQATAVAVERAIDQLAAQLLPGDQAIVVFIGHGSYDGAEYRLNLPGPDLTGTRLATLLDRLPATVPQLVVNATSASGAMLSRLQRPQRVVITATQSAGERNATRYAAHWARALVSAEADRDKDEAVTAVEAFDYATRQVAEAFKADAAIATEHAQLRGADPAPATPRCRPCAASRSRWRNSSGRSRRARRPWARSAISRRWNRCCARSPGRTSASRRASSSSRATQELCHDALVPDLLCRPGRAAGPARGGAGVRQ